MKLNWGYTIVTFYILFVLGILFMVVQANDQKIDLVTKYYYEEELKYQDRIEELSRAKQLSEAVKFKFESDKIFVVLPKEFSGKKVIGSIHLYYPADEKKDRNFNFSEEGNQFSHQLHVDSKGMHIVKLRWVSNNTSYYTEENIFIH
ncbi:MAG: FixH family protein [Chitinophagaceae bacterium]